MNYIAIYDYDEKTDVAMACVLGEKPSMEPIAYWKKPIPEIITLVINNKFKPLNFGIDRNKNLQQDNGSFSRFIKEGSLVILAEFVNEKKEIIGYRVLSTTNGTPFNMTLADLKQLYNKRKVMFKKDSIVFIQNAIIRQYDDDITISCYPLKSFEQIEIKRTEKKANAPIVVDKAKKVKKTEKKDKNSAFFTQKQKKELDLCKEAGVDPKLVSDPNLSIEQMRVIWFSKAKKGALSEYFNKPAFSADAMKFYADLLYDEKQVKTYKPLLDHPELNTAQLQELINCIDNNIEYEDLIGLDVDDIYCQRIERDPKFWSVVDFDSKAPSKGWRKSELFDLMMKETMRIHSKGV